MANEVTRAAHRSVGSSVCMSVRSRLRSSFSPRFRPRLPTPPLVRACLLAGSLLTTLGAASHTAAADDDDLKLKGFAIDLADAFKLWEKVDGRFQLGNDVESRGKLCDSALAGLTKANAPDSLTFDLQNDTPELKAGPHRWTEGRATCASLRAAIKRAAAISEIRDAVNGCFDAMTQAGGPSAAYPFTWDQHAYDKMIKAGLAPTEPIASRAGSGTVQAQYDKWCVAGKAKLDAAAEQRAAPFKKVLKNDKLAKALRDFDFLMLPGGAKVTPERLAAMNVWFEDASPSRQCSNGLQVHVLHRYQFNAQHKLVKVTDREFCGRPPASALR